MGFNWRRLGYPSVDAFVDSMGTDAGQIEAFVRYILADPILHRALIAGDWQTVARRYNGAGYAAHGYDRKLEAAEARHRGAGSPRAARMLVRGDQGDDVAELQRALQRAGFSLIAIDGDFGPATEAAVRAFQQREGLTVDGKAGPMTKAELGIVR